jgi:predicted TIM-barrel fold metal-dependent hydrolase
MCVLLATAAAGQAQERLRLYIENAGFPFLDETIALLYRYPNVYVDVSTITCSSPGRCFSTICEG